jgi:quercetin dioxygenase-like cupin family protein
MKSTAALALSLSLAGGTFVAQDATVRSLLSKDLAGDPGREVSMITVEYPPGGSNPVHTHHAQALVNVLEGSIVMRLRGGAPITLAPCQTVYEGPDDVDIVSRNAGHTAGQVPGMPGEGQRRTDFDARQVTSGVPTRPERRFKREVWREISL